ncbi:MAG: response regulator [Candidatus Omnitrophica bacterium]|nr:response regulator [Candidatus Omnitrophota bacterium]
MIQNIFFRSKIIKKKTVSPANAKGEKDKCPLKPIKILIIEDELTTRETFAAILKDCDYKVETAESGRQAVEKTGKEFFHVAFIDIILGEVNGVDTLRMIKAMSPQTVCIMMTAYSVEDMINTALEAGAATCIFKPFDVDKTIELIKKVCDKTIH